MEPTKESAKVKVLLIDDDVMVARSLCQAIAEESSDAFEFEHAKLLSTGLDRLSKGGIDLILLDLNLPDSRGSESVARTHSCAPQVPIIVLSAMMNAEIAIEATRKGAQDCVGKASFPEDLLPSLVSAMHATIERKQAGTLAGAVKIARETSGSKRVVEEADQERQQMAEELKRAQSELDVIQYVFFHDLKRPLAVVNNSLYILERHHKHKLDENAKQCIGMARDSIGEIDEMIRALLTYSLARRTPLRLEPVHINDILQHVIGDIKPAIEETKAMVTCSHLPDVIVDPAMLRQLIWHLLVNAIKFRSEAAPAVHVFAEQKGAVWRFSIRDNGIGIASDDFERIFRPFIRLHTSQQYSGMGIGLAVCERIVQRHGGRIWVESERGKGATFHFTIPVLKDEHCEKG